MTAAVETGATLEAIDHFYFGDPEASLFGAYHIPAAVTPRSCGVVLCPPGGHEYIRSHRAIRQLALRLARAGFPVLRFDYYACGDSAGEDAQGDPDHWLGDIAVAIHVLQRRSGVPRMALVGLRLGAALAALAGAARANLARLVLWDPVVSGQAYIAELAALHAETLWRYANRPRDALGGAAPTELLGFPLSEAARAQLQGLDLLTLAAPPAPAVLIIEREALAPVAQVREHLRGLGAHVDHQVVADPKIWNENVDKALVPHATLQAIVAWLSQIRP